MTTFHDVIAKWDDDARGGGQSIHPLPPDSAEFWALGEIQAAQVNDYAEAGNFVIDFGAGIGRLSFPLVEMGFDVLAVDSSAAMLDTLAHRAREIGTDVTPACSDGSNLHEFLDGRRADVVIARAVLIHHSYGDVVKLVTDLAAVLRPGGHLIADWPTDANPAERTHWIGVTTWSPEARTAVAKAAGLELVADAEPGDASVWRKTGDKA